MLSLDNFQSNNENINLESLTDSFIKQVLIEIEWAFNLRSATESEVLNKQLHLVLLS